MAQSEQAPMEMLQRRLRHPIRRSVFAAAVDIGPVSPTQLTTILGWSLSTLAYHVRMLAECGALKLVELRPARGSTEHFYVCALDPNEARAMIDKAEREAAAEGGHEDGGQGVA